MVFYKRVTNSRVPNEYCLQMINFSIALFVRNNNKSESSSIRELLHLVGKNVLGTCHYDKKQVVTCVSVSNYKSLSSSSA